MRRKNCALMIIFLYALLVLLLYIPVAAMAYWNDLALLLSAYKLGYFWLTFLLLVIIQAALLYIPVRDTANYFIKPRHIAIPLLAGSLALGILLASVVFSILFAYYGDKGVNIFWPHGFFTVVILAWIIWALIFRQSWRSSQNPRAFMMHTSGAIKKGSLLELLIAVGCHIIIRWRGDCSAGHLTFCGILMGIALGFLAFGPGLLYAFMERREKMLPRSRRPVPPSPPTP